ncbi:ABC transporter ATP-binding protein [Kitasatospora xanthocidica]|uniref:ABC transporter ATP-binding protein n=1 Tax=Kitasatospora xanthocidica TaxID=83382 RepID=A0A372ZS15_9ACTN|nr:ABC transporter ATP-binding protein [Kitasatospora xanthocidica]RGD58190.1 ABC transporter ATP-binding protein [Kitasatospora xanthocidica]
MTARPATAESPGTVTAADGAPRLATSALSLGHDRTIVVRELDLELPQRQVTVIVGPNGCGKSTLLGGLARTIAPRSGAVLLDGKPLTSLSTRAIARIIGLLPQSATAPDGLTVRDLVRYGRQPHQGLLRQWSAADAEAVEHALAAADLHELADRPLDTLSGGQRQRAWIAMAVAQDTDILMLDEPTSALDMGHALEVLEMVRGLTAERGRTVVLVLHDLTTACRYADHMVAMRDGRVAAQGAPRDIVTPELVRELYGVESVILTDPVHGTPVVCPVGLAPRVR